LAWRVWDGGFHVRYDGEIEVYHPAIQPTRIAEFYRFQARNRVWLAGATSNADRCALSLDVDRGVGDPASVAHRLAGNVARLSDWTRQTGRRAAAAELADNLANDTRRASTGNLTIMAEMNNRAWLEWAIGQVEADANRSADTHLHTFPLPAEWGINLYLKDESVHPTGSLKHRLARSLVLYGLCNNWITEGTTLVEASVDSRVRPASRDCSTCRS
jgi:hypothetical protein